MSSCCCCSLIDGDKGTDGEVGIEGADAGDVPVVTFVISFIIVVMLLSIIGDSCCCTSEGCETNLTWIYGPEYTFYHCIIPINDNLAF